jgi:hypothetical protein
LYNSRDIIAFSIEAAEPVKVIFASRVDYIASNRDVEVLEGNSLELLVYASALEFARGIDPAKEDNSKKDSDFDYSKDIVNQNILFL